MKIKTKAKISSPAAVRQPLVVLDVAACRQVSGGGPNGGWGQATSVVASPGTGGQTVTGGGPNGGWAVVAGGPNGGW